MLILLFYLAWLRHIFCKFCNCNDTECKIALTNSRSLSLDAHICCCSLFLHPHNFPPMALINVLHFWHNSFSIVVGKSCGDCKVRKQALEQKSNIFFKFWRSQSLRIDLKNLFEIAK